MELKDFVAQSIKGICEGIHQANIQVNHLGCVVCPQLSPEGIAKDKEEREVPQLIHFDIAVTVQHEALDIAKGGSVTLGPVSFGRKTEEGERDEHQHVSRLAFALPVRLPSVEPVDPPATFPAPSDGDSPRFGENYRPWQP